MLQLDNLLAIRLFVFEVLSKGSVTTLLPSTLESSPNKINGPFTLKFLFILTPAETSNSLPIFTLPEILRSLLISFKVIPPTVVILPPIKKYHYQYSIYHLIPLFLTFKF